MSDALRHVTLVSVTGLPDARGAALALRVSLDQLPGTQAVLCSPVAPPGLDPRIRHMPLAPMHYHEYSWFMLFALWRVIPTEFALVVQDDGWVLDGNLWQDDWLQYDFIGAPIHLAHVLAPDGERWLRGFEWTRDYGQPGYRVHVVQNGGFSLRSQRMMRALVERPHLHVRVPPPDHVDTFPAPMRMRWSNDALLEDVQLTGVLRPELEAAGLRFAPLEVARWFSIEHAAPLLHEGLDALKLFGHHSKLRRLDSLDPPTVRCALGEDELDQVWGERDLLQMLERRGYRIEFARAPAAAPARRRVYDCFTYNGEAEVLAIHLHELAEVVDCFVIVEADRTFSGAPKPLRFDPADPRVAPFASRIRYVAVHDMPDDGLDQAAVPGDWLLDEPQTAYWRREKHQRDQIMRGLGDAGPDDLVLISDVDEIPRAQVVAAMRDGPTHALFGLSLAFYYFRANYRNVEGPEAACIWTVAASYRSLAQSSPHRLRMGIRLGRQNAQLVADAGWHLSYLGMDDDAIRQKIRAFSHQEYNDAAFLAGIDLQALMAAGGDLYGRPGYRWQVVSPDEAPQWLRQQQGLRHLFLDPQVVPTTLPA